VNVFECIHPVCGHVNMLIGMADDPDWVKDMADTYARLTIDLQKMLFEREGLPDGVWYYEDMGYKGSPFMSPAMYRDIIQPAHAATIGCAHGLGLPVIMHSCGYVAPLLPGMIEAGIDCLQVIEVKAGMDLLELHRLYGGKIAFMGGIDVRALYTNDRAVIDAELEAKIPVAKQGYNLVLHSDHSIPKTVEYGTYRYFVQKGLELGTY
jgi:uroporphyrinogen decarboxylase